jgi:glycosyltransferase involved in cell wall biosynthesis
MRRVLVLTSHHPSRREPARAMYGYYTYRALARYCDIRFLAPVAWWTRARFPGDLMTPPRERWGDVGIEYPPYWSIPGATSLHGLALAASLARRVAALHRASPFEAVLTAWAYPDGFAAAVVAAVLGVPLIATVLGSDVNELPKVPALRWQIRAGLRRAARVVSVSEALGDEVARLGVPRERIVVAHNGVDGEVFALRDRGEARAALGIPRDRALVGYVGNLVPEKGPDMLVEAMAALVKRRTAPVGLAILGAGVVEPALRRRVGELGIADRVSFLGRRTHDEVPRWISALDVLCLPSRREGCPNVVLEALASGRPVVASSVGGVPELLCRDNGILVPPDRSDALADALHRALDRSWDAATLRATVPSLSWDAVARTYSRLVSEVIAERVTWGAPDSTRTPGARPPRWRRAASSRGP